MLLVKCWWQSPLAIFFFNTCSPIIRLIPHSNPTNTHEVIRQNLLFLASYLLSCCFRCFKSLCYLLMFLSWGDNNLLHKHFSVFQLKWISFLLWLIVSSVQFSSVHFSRSVVSDSLRPHESQHARPPCPSATPGVHSDSNPSSQWCHPAISSSVVPFSSCPQSLPASESFQMSQLFAWGGQSTGVSALASFLPKNTQDWSNECVNIVWIVISIKHFEIVCNFAV